MQGTEDLTITIEGQPPFVVSGASNGQGAAEISGELSNDDYTVSGQILDVVSNVLNLHVECYFVIGGPDDDVFGDGGDEVMGGGSGP